MKDEEKTKGQLVNELARLRQRIAKLEALETERKRAEEAISTSERMLRNILRSIKDLVFVFDKEGRFTRYYAPPDELYLLPEEFLWKKHSEIMPTHINRLFVEALNKNKKGEVAEYEYQIEIGSEAKWFSTKLSPIFSDSEFAGSVAVVRNITERKRAEEKLRERVKELTCLYAINNDMQEDLSVDELCWRVIGHLVSAMHLPEIAVPMIELYGRRFTSKKYTKELSHNLHAEIKVGGQARGKVWIYYAEEKPFLIPEEQIFINSIAESLGRWLERKQAQKTVKAEKEFSENILNAVVDTIFVFDPNTGNPLRWNKAFAEISGYTDEEIASKKAPDEWYNEEDIKKAKAESEKLFRGEKSIIELSLITKKGKMVPTEYTASLIKDSEGNPLYLIAVGRDITERKRVEEELAYMATHDNLTALPNRMLFNDRFNVALAQTQRHQQRLAVMLLDLDYFKNVNDTLGHRVGDQLLQVVSNRLTGLLRKGDTVARMGGDEFLFLLPEIARVEDATGIAQKILEELRKPIVIDGHKLNITTSLGVTIYPDDSEDTDTLMKYADIAMYEAKKKGRNNYQCYSPTMEIRT